MTYTYFNRSGSVFIDKGAAHKIQVAPLVVNMKFNYIILDSRTDSYRGYSAHNG